MDTRKTGSEGEERVTLERAVRLLLDHCSIIAETERCSVLDCTGRILADDVYAKRDQPPFDRSPVDGYACRSCDITDASSENPVYLEVV